MRRRRLILNTLLLIVGIIAGYFAIDLIGWLLKGAWRFITMKFIPWGGQLVHGVQTGDPTSIFTAILIGFLGLIWLAVIIRDSKDCNKQTTNTKE